MSWNQPLTHSFGNGPEQGDPLNTITGSAAVFDATNVTIELGGPTMTLPGSGLLAAIDAAQGARAAFQVDPASSLGETFRIVNRADDDDPYVEFDEDADVFKIVKLVGPDAGTLVFGPDLLQELASALTSLGY